MAEDTNTEKTDSITPELVEEPNPAVTSLVKEAGEEEAIEQPSKVIRMGAMLGQLLEEVRSAELDEPGRERLKEIYDLSLKELGSAVSDDLREELDRLAKPFGDDEIPTGSELRVAKAQLVGWLEGLVQGIQATLYAQQVAARQQLSNIRHKIGQPPDASQLDETPHGTYL